MRFLAAILFGVWALLLSGGCGGTLGCRLQPPVSAFVLSGGKPEPAGVSECREGWRGLYPGPQRQGLARGPRAEIRHGAIRFPVWSGAFCHHSHYEPPDAVPRRSGLPVRLRKFSRAGGEPERFRPRLSHQRRHEPARNRQRAIRGRARSRGLLTTGQLGCRVQPRNRR